MKKHYIVPLCLIIMAIFLTGCEQAEPILEAEESAKIQNLLDNSDDTSPEAVSTEIPSTIQPQQSDTPTLSTETPIAAPPGTSVANDKWNLFDSVFAAYARREYPHDYESVMPALSQLNYEIAYSEELDISGISHSITVSAPQGDQVIFYFYPNIEGEELLMSMTYFCGENGRQVIFSNTSDSRTKDYDKLIVLLDLETPEYVSSTEEQKNFLIG